MRRVVPLIAALALLGGCSQATDGSANPGGPTPTTTAGRPSGSDRPSSTATGPVDRPKAIDVAGVDPCALLTGAQRAEFGLDQPPQPNDDAPGKKSCTISRGDREHFVGITADTTAGVDDYAKSEGKVTRLEVGGFPALLVEADTALGLSCSVTVDVADGQVVDVGAFSLGEVDLTGLCRIVQPVAAAVVTNLDE
ncbi:DUF3558 domain-containing protein [Saccharothrix texasensis]|uniref:Uncharacterized protein DUF3558 n=1 Tax=Saccharothrix texasensis TaxID=103734 RepID=A0A3N1HAU6_9PSEU|nr:DUF3558 domain-containing protein [Saccharothrix texasensis]ROP39578.1 uncharacterized protein DUF3558 [Saccharothrix texasensis]